MSVRTRFAQAVAARDPGRARLAVATAVSAGVLGSAVLTLAIVHLLDAHPALLAMSVLLSVQAGTAVKDRTPADRVTTAALLLPSVVLALSVAIVLTPWRPAVIAVFILLTGFATWLRRFGPRPAAMATLGFLAYFFTLFMKPTIEELPAYGLVALGAVTTQLVARSFLLLRRPGHELALLLDELRAASASALEAAFRADHPRTLRLRLARIDDVGRAITEWQQRFRTDLHAACDEQTLETRVLGARADTEESCYALASITASTEQRAHSAPARAYTHLRVVLHVGASATPIADSRAWAERALARDDGAHGISTAVELLAESTIAHAQLREIPLSYGNVLESIASAPRASAAPPARNRARRPRPRRPWRSTPWNQWDPTSRMAIQAMIAASIATVAGEAISATRWYWAVLTAFVIFVGTTTRSGILTRAYRRVVGTAAGIGVGVGAVLLANHHSDVLIVVFVLSVFGMLYFGPVNYVYSAFFMSILIVTIYSMLGVLDHRILELRLAETVTGAVIGVLCAYLILSSNSHPTLMATVNSYFDALDRLLASVSSAFDAREQSRDVFATVRALDAAQADVNHDIAGMSTAFLFGRHDRQTSALHLMSIATRSAARLAQSAVARRSGPRPLADDVRRALDDAIRETRASATRARRSLGGLRDTDDAAPEQPSVFWTLDRFPSRSNSPETAAVLALTRIDWAMRHVLNDMADDDGHRRRASAVTVPPVASRSVG